MPTYFQRPENALKRADEFIDVGKNERALEVLYDVIKSKKHRTWQKTHEQIMEKYLKLCVELRKSHIAKEGLYQYKNICQQVNINSLVEVVKSYIALAEQKTESARKESHQTVVDIDDLDLPDSPESLLLKAVSGEDLQDRTDRTILTPWVKFLWESYRQCLDLLRNNSRVERLYQDIAQQAFKFCLKYARKTEFRKLCDNLRTHLMHIHKHQNQQTAINLNNPDSQAMHLETRLVQLDSAITMELFQEAFKAVEDIHGLITLSKKQPKPALMANYFQKLSLVFSKSGNHLFHACTLHRLFVLSREQRKNLSVDELQKMASKVLCATLAVPIPPARNAIGNLLVMDESAVEKQRKLATLLMRTSPPIRQSLVSDLVKNGLIQYAYPELQNLYQYLEVDFHPLSLYSKVKPIVEMIEKNEELAQYVPQIEDIIITRVLKQVSQVYQQIKFSRFSGLVPFANEYRLERVIVEAAKTLELQVRIDHRTGSLSFGTDLGVSQKEDVPEGPYIQSMPSEQIRNQVINIAQALNQAMEIIGPKERSKLDDEDLKASILNQYRLTAKKEHMRILQRRQIIENRKEQLEQNQDQREREEIEQIEEQRRKAYEAEMERLEKEAEERNKQRQLEEHEMIKKRHVKERIEELRKTPHGAKILENINEEEIADLDVDEIMAKQVEQLEKEKKELQERLKTQEKKVDYFARAKRILELPLLKEQYDEAKKADKLFWEEQEKERIANSKIERAQALEAKARMSLMKADLETFTNTLKKAKKSEYEDKLKDFEMLVNEERRKRMYDRKQQRKEERRQKWIQEKEEAAQRARDEQLKLEREAKEREEQEKREEEERAYQEHKAKLDEQLKKQLAREREIEEREAKKREEERRQREEQREKERGGTDESSWRRSGDGGKEGDRDGDRDGTNRPKVGGWRQREAEKENSWRARGGDDDRDPDDDRRNDRDDVRGPPRAGDRDIRGPPKDFRDRDVGDRDGRGPPRDDHGPRDDFRGPPRGGDREREFRDDRRDFRDRGPPRDDWRGGRPDDRDRRTGGGDNWRAAPREIPSRDRGDRDRDGPRDSWRERRDERGPPARDDWRGDRDRGAPPSRDGPRGGGGGGSWRGRDDGPPRGGYRDEPRRDMEEGGWRRGGPPDREDRDDRRGPRDDRRDDRRGPRDERRGPDSDRRGPDSDRRGPYRDERRGPPARGGDDVWRRGEAPPARTEKREPERKHEKKESAPTEDDDGWTTVRY